VLATAALVVCAAPAAADIKVPVRRCTTAYGVPGASFKQTRSALLDVSAAHAKRLVAWAGGGTPVVLAPKGFACSALVGADGGVHVRLAPPGARKTGPAVDIEVEGACVGCIAQLACGVFRGAEKQSGLPCTTPHPAAERVRRLIANVRAFHDPPDVKGSGDPSGGPYAALGAIVYVPDKTDFAARVTCTIDTRSQDLCGDVIADFLGRVGR
jgi:hypothetical protein